MLFDNLALMHMNPSEDPPTNQFVKSLFDSVRGLDEFNFSMGNYVYEFIDKLERAKNSIGQRDETESEAFRAET